MSAGMVCFVLNDTLVKFVSDDLPAPQLIFLRGLMAVAVLNGATWEVQRTPTTFKTGSGLSAAEAVMMMNRDKAVVIDVCEAGEYAQGHIAGARNIPLAQLEAQLPGAVKNKATPLILVCQAGVRSARAVAAAKKLGYENAQSLAGGLKAWRDANMPVSKA